jgi:hypothetical protein
VREGMRVGVREGVWECGSGGGRRRGKEDVSE